LIIIALRRVIYGKTIDNRNEENSKVKMRKFEKIAL